MRSKVMIFIVRGGRFLVLLCVCLTLSGCPYESKVPLGPAEEAVIDRALLGTWECRSDKDDPPWSLSVFRFDSRQYYMYITAPNEKPAHFRAYGTLIQGRPFLNVHELDSREKTPEERYWLLSYDLEKNGHLSMKIIRDELLKNIPDTSSALRESIGKQIGNPRLFEDFCLCRRMPDKNVPGNK